MARRLLGLSVPPALSGWTWWTVVARAPHSQRWWSRARMRARCRCHAQPLWSTHVRVWVGQGSRCGQSGTGQTVRVMAAAFTLASGCGGRVPAMRPVSLVVSWVVLLVTTALAFAGVIGSATQLVVNALVVGYGFGRVHALYWEARRDARQTAAALSSLVDRMGSALASDELSDDERPIVQRQRAAMLALLAEVERPPLGRRVLARLRR